METQFEWDPDKAEANVRKHGVTFDEASSVFADPLAAIFDDEDHSTEEQREVIIGYSIQGRLIVAAFTERGGAVRIISARRATKREMRDHEQRPNG
jgi:uncharacterized protein